MCKYLHVAGILSFVPRISIRGSCKGSLSNRDHCLHLKKAKFIWQGLWDREVVKTLCVSLCFAGWGWSPPFSSWASDAKVLIGFYPESKKLSYKWATSQAGVGSFPAVCVLAQWGRGNHHRAQQSHYLQLAVEVLPGFFPSPALQAALTAMLKRECVGQTLHLAFQVTQ